MHDPGGLVVARKVSPSTMNPLKVEAFLPVNTICLFRVVDVISDDEGRTDDDGIADRDGRRDGDDDSVGSDDMDGRPLGDIEDDGELEVDGDNEDIGII